MKIKFLCKVCGKTIGYSESRDLDESVQKYEILCPKCHERKFHDEAEQTDLTGEIKAGTVKPKDAEKIKSLSKLTDFEEKEKLPSLDDLHHDFSNI